MDRISSPIFPQTITVIPFLFLYHKPMGPLSHRVLLRPGVDCVFDVLSSQYRRRILIELNSGYATNEMHVISRGGPDDEVDLQLCHSHLPQMVEAGYIEWDRETSEIEPGPCFDQIKPLLDLVEAHADELPDDWP